MEIALAVRSQGRDRQNLDLERWFRTGPRASYTGCSGGMQRELHGLFAQGRCR